MTLLIYDFDMVLVRSWDIFRETMRKIEEQGIQIPWKLSEKIDPIICGMSHTNMVKAISEFNQQRITPETIDRYKNDYMKQLYAKACLECKESLIDLHNRGIRQAIVSSNTKEVIYSVLNNPQNADVVFDPPVYACSGRSKSDVIKDALRYHGIDGKNSYYIGDHFNDVLEGKKAGTKTIGITTGGCDRNELARYHPDFIIDSLNELTTYF